MTSSLHGLPSKASLSRSTCGQSLTRWRISYNPEEWVEMVRRRKETMKSSVTTEKILAWKDMDRR